MNELDHISHSQVNLWKRCPRQWEAKYILGVREKPNENLIIGSCYHSALEENFRFKLETNEDLDMDIIYDVFSTAWANYKERNDGIRWVKLDEGKAKDLCYSLVECYMDSIAPLIYPLEIEQRYDSSVAGVNFVLILDLIDQNGAVIDHKTSARAYLESDVHKDPQASATAFVLGRPIVFYNHVAVKSKTPYIQKVKTIRSEADINWWVNQTTAIVEHMKSGYAPPNDGGWWCSPAYCPIYEDCTRDLARSIYV